MLSPGAKGWITKYFDLVDHNEIALLYKKPNNLSTREYLRITFASCGLVYGFPAQLIFAKKIDTSKWTNEEQLKILRFESHLVTYLSEKGQKEFSKDKFIAALFDFYRFHNVRSLKDVFSFFKRDTTLEVLEGILAKRVDIKMNLMDNKWWVNSLSNAFAYIDVILFHDYIIEKEHDSIINYNGFAQNALTGIVLAAYADGEIQEKERSIFNVFLASSGLEEEKREKAKELFRAGAQFDDFSPYVKDKWLLKHFILDIAALTIFSGSDMLDEEIEFMKELEDYLACEEGSAEESLVLVENFVLKTQDKAIFLSDSGSYEKVYLSFTNRWKKVLLRNKDKIALELKESRQLINLIGKSTTEELSAEEKEKVKEQLKDLAKAVPALTIFMLPGGSILMPLLMKALPDLVPSAFRDNKLDDSENKSDQSTSEK